MRFTAVILFLMFATTTCSNKSIQKPEMVGKKVFEILKNIKNTSNQGIIDSYIPYEELPIGMLENYTKEEMFKQLEKSHNRIKKLGDRYGIVWKEIEYMDFHYDINTVNGITICQGFLQFKSKNKQFQIEILAAQMEEGEEYKILGITKNLIII